MKADETIRSESGVVPPETVVPLATTTEPAAVSGGFFRTGREEVDVPDGDDDPELRQRLRDRSAQLAGLADDG